MDDPTKTRGLLADLGHSDACVHPDQHAAVIREWEDAKAKLDAKLKRKAIGRAYVELQGFADRETARADAAEADVGMWTNFCRDQRQRAEQAEADVATLRTELEAVHLAADAGDEMLQRERDRHAQTARARDALKAATDRVRAEHALLLTEIDHGSWCGTCHVGWPCPTIAAMPTDTTGEGDKPDWRKRARARVGDRVAARMQELLAEPDEPETEPDPAEHTAGNAEDCPRCTGRRDLAYPFICPGTNPDTTGETDA